jgi:hypothetical protein
MITTVIAKTPDEAELVRATLQRRVLSLGLFQDGDVGVGVFPEGEEILTGIALAVSPCMA